MEERQLLSYSLGAEKITWELQFGVGQYRNIFCYKDDDVYCQLLRRAVQENIPFVKNGLLKNTSSTQNLIEQYRILFEGESMFATRLGANPQTLETDQKLIKNQLEILKERLFQHLNLDPANFDVKHAYKISQFLDSKHKELEQIEKLNEHIPCEKEQTAVLKKNIQDLEEQLSLLSKIEKIVNSLPQEKELEAFQTKMADSISALRRLKKSLSEASQPLTGKTIDWLSGFEKLAQVIVSKKMAHLFNNEEKMFVEDLPQLFQEYFFHIEKLYQTNDSSISSMETLKNLSFTYLKELKDKRNKNKIFNFFVNKEEEENKQRETEEVLYRTVCAIDALLLHFTNIKERMGNSLQSVTDLSEKRKNICAIVSKKNAQSVEHFSDFLKQNELPPIDSFKKLTEAMLLLQMYQGKIYEYRIYKGIQEGFDQQIKDLHEYVLAWQKLTQSQRMFKTNSFKEIILEAKSVLRYRKEREEGLSRVREKMEYINAEEKIKNTINERIDETRKNISNFCAQYQLNKDEINFKDIENIAYLMRFFSEQFAAIDSKIKVEAFDEKSNALIRFWLLPKANLSMRERTLFLNKVREFNPHDLNILIVKDEEVFDLLVGTDLGVINKKSIEHIPEVNARIMASSPVIRDNLNNPQTERKMQLREKAMQTMAILNPSLHIEP